MSLMRILRPVSLALFLFVVFVGKKSYHIILSRFVKFESFFFAVKRDKFIFYDSFNVHTVHELICLCMRCIDFGAFRAIRISE